MGWASGSELMNEIIGAIKRHVPDPKTRAKVYPPIISAFEDYDWDTQDECLGIDPVFDKIIEKQNEES